MYTISNAITQAKQKIISFCLINQIELNPKILDTPVKGLNEFFENRDNSVKSYSIEEAIDELADSESMIITDDFTEMPVILFDEAKMNELDFDEQVQIFIHEYLHYYEAIQLYEKEGFVDFINPADEEAEDEIISILINLYHNKKIEDSLPNLAKRINAKKIIVSYNDVEIAISMLEKVHTIGLNEIAKKLQIEQKGCV